MSCKADSVLRQEKCHLSKEETIQQLCEGMKMEVDEAEKYYEEYRKDVQKRRTDKFVKSYIEDVH